MFTYHANKIEYQTTDTIGRFSYP